MVLGLVPDCDLAHVAPAGNAAGTGALIALLSGAARTEIEGVVREVDKIETAVEPRFQEHSSMRWRSRTGRRRRSHLSRGRDAAAGRRRGRRGRRPGARRAHAAGAAAEQIRRRPVRRKEDR